jgi:hypothetical protein
MKFWELIETDEKEIGETLIYINPKQIDAFRAEGNSTLVAVGNTVIRVKENINDFMARFQDE